MANITDCQCGSERVYVQPIGGYWAYLFYVRCMECGLKTQWRNTPTEAIEDWNNHKIYPREIRITPGLEEQSQPAG